MVAKELEEVVYYSYDQWLDLLRPYVEASLDKIL